MILRNRYTLAFVIAFALLGPAKGQSTAEYGSGLKIDLNEEGSKYLRFIFWNQLWARSIENNPGTLVGGEASGRTFDIGARRIRTIAYAQLTPRYLILTHFGIDNQNFNTGGSSGGKKPQIFYHDAWNEYALFPAKNLKTGKANKSSLYFGAGLHYWNGVSRLTAASTLNMLMLDAPLFNWPTLEVSDQIIRQFGMYAKGTLGRLHYQTCLNKPFATSTNPVAGGAAVDNNGDPKASLGGYVDFQFLEQEANVLPFRVGTYLGTKKVLNIGAGFYHNKDATRSLTADNTLKKHDINILSADLFADLPFGGRQSAMALTAYSVYYDYDFGPRYIRTSGVMNPGLPDPAFTGVRAQEGAGNARYMLGTGNIWYTQAGVLLPKTISKKVRIQPIAAFTLKDLDALAEKGQYYDVGTNLLIDAHNAKLTFQYSDRPLYHNDKVFKRAAEYVVQFQIFL